MLGDTLKVWRREVEISLKEREMTLSSLAPTRGCASKIVSFALSCLSVLLTFGILMMVVVLILPGTSVVPGVLPGVPLALFPVQGSLRSPSLVQGMATGFAPRWPRFFLHLQRASSSMHPRRFQSAYVVKRGGKFSTLSIAQVKPANAGLNGRPPLIFHAGDENDSRSC